MTKIILLLNPVYVTFFWALILTFHNGKQQVPKLFLGKFMFVAFILYLSHLFYFTGRFEVYYYLDSIYTLASLLVYPLYHIYVRLLTVDKWFSVRQHGKYLVIPLVVFFLHLTGYILMEKGEAMHYLKMVLPGVTSGEGVAGYMGIIYFVFRTVFILQVIFYLHLNYRLIFQYNSRLRDFYSNLENRDLNWVQFFNFSLAVISLASAIAAAFGRDAFAVNELSLAFPSIIFSVMLFLIGLLGNVQRRIELEEEPAEGGKVTSAAGSRSGHIYEPDGLMVRKPEISDIESDTFPEEKYQDTLKLNMENLFKEELIFRDPDLKIWALSNMLGTNRTYVSKVINREYGRNFCNHVNHYRVEYAKMIIKTSYQITNEEIAELSGFGSVNSLYRAFQSVEKRSLGDFRKDPG
jgi:AraC-like DNA-binding protein